MPELRSDLRPPDVDRRLHYRNDPRGSLGECRIRVWFHVDRLTPTTVVVTELPENPGPSVTNSAEAVASAVEALLAQPLDRIDVVEHYEPTLIRGHALTLVDFDGRGRDGRPSRPTWWPLPSRLAWLNAALAVPGA